MCQLTLFLDNDAPLFKVFEKLHCNYLLVLSLTINLFPYLLTGVYRDGDAHVL